MKKNIHRYIYVLYGFLFTQREQDYVKSRVICFLFTLIFNV